MRLIACSLQHIAMMLAARQSHGRRAPVQEQLTKHTDRVRLTARTSAQRGSARPVRPFRAFRGAAE